MDERNSLRPALFTGSKEHNTHLRGIAKTRDSSSTEYGLFKGEKNLPCKNEEEIYRAIGLALYSPEAREDSGEIEFALQSFSASHRGQDLKASSRALGVQRRTASVSGDGNGSGDT